MIYGKILLKNSPHAWSRFSFVAWMLKSIEKFSTCVEQMAEIDARLKELEKHLHMRGADNAISSLNTMLPETSPHAWSRFCCFRLRLAAGRNISTCVEQMDGRGQKVVKRGKHLHMRGADRALLLMKKSQWETSPHAWSRCLPSCRQQGGRGNISTCVEQIVKSESGQSVIEKHLHMRGADDARDMGTRSLRETSPHAWSILDGIEFTYETSGNISTCVEQIEARSSPCAPGRKHLHMRGADPKVVLAPLLCRETSPHAWSRSKIFENPLTIPRNISTCVEQIAAGRRAAQSCRKHLHMRGADAVSPGVDLDNQETSPHAWSRLLIPCAI